MATNLRVTLAPSNMSATMYDYIPGGVTLISQPDTCTIEDFESRQVITLGELRAYWAAQKASRASAGGTTTPMITDVVAGSPAGEGSAHG